MGVRCLQFSAQFSAVAFLRLHQLETTFVTTALFPDWPKPLLTSWHVAHSYSKNFRSCGFLPQSWSNLFNILPLTACYTYMHQHYSCNLQIEAVDQFSSAIFRGCTWIELLTYLLLVQVSSLGSGRHIWAETSRTETICLGCAEIIDSFLNYKTSDSWYTSPSSLSSCCVGCTGGLNH